MTSIRPAYFTVTGYGTGFAPVILKSDNGTSWEKLADVDTDGHGITSMYAYQILNNNYYGVIGTTASDEYNILVWDNSTDEWKPNPNNEKNGANLSGGVWGFNSVEDILLACGAGEGSRIAHAFNETNGINSASIPSLQCNAMASGYAGINGLDGYKIVVVGTSDADSTTLAIGDLNYEFDYIDSNHVSFDVAGGGSDIAYGRDDKTQPMFVAVGKNSDDNYKSIIRSNNGKFWLPSSSSGMSFTDGANCVGYGVSGDGSPIWVAAGSYSSPTSAPAVARSKDGYLWETVPLTDTIKSDKFYPQYIQCGMSSDEKTPIWILGGVRVDESTDNNGSLLYSYDSVNWYSSFGTSMVSVAAGANWYNNPKYPGDGHPVKKAELDFYAGN